MPPETSLEVIINCRSGTNDESEVLRRLNDLFEASGLRAHISLAKSGGQIVDLARRAAQGDSQTVVAGGGDGTVSSIAAELVGTSKILGVLPLGTLNHFAKDLHIPIDLEGAVNVISGGRTLSVDVGEVNGYPFLNNSSLGLYPSLVRERRKQQRLGFGKWPAFLWAAIAVLRRYPFLNVKLSVDGKEFASRTPFVFVGNNQYEMEGLKIGGRRGLSAGELSLYITHRTGRLGLLRLALRALCGTLRNERDFMAMTTREVSIQSRKRRLRVAADGEVTLMEPPLHYRVRPAALRVFVPAPLSE
ncbi:MAG: diacylglycerol/lipid kinase family protein [Pyrinomonadaceae bacterium]